MNQSHTNNLFNASKKWDASACAPGFGVTGLRRVNSHMILFPRKGALGLRLEASSPQAGRLVF
ncbi:MAG: hypothetical protein AAF571_11205 [Verrucomicrobiota bacterium]